MTTLLVGFDSAWTPGNAGAIVGVLQGADGKYQELGPPQTADFTEAGDQILAWQASYQPVTTIILLDQPTIVANASGQRPVEHLVCSPVSLRYGGMQPASTGRAEMFGETAPVWSFLSCFGGAASPWNPGSAVQVYETYPVLVMIALGWLLPDTRPTGRLPKYNPGRRKTFQLVEWEFVCHRAQAEFANRGLSGLAGWMENAAALVKPRKSDQDQLDACLCLLVALHLAERKDCLVVGNAATGYIMVPGSEELTEELHARCDTTGRLAGDWVHRIGLRL